jgi:hypothetical protein
LGKKIDRFIPSKKISKQDCLDGGALVVLGRSSRGKSTIILFQLQQLSAKQLFYLKTKPLTCNKNNFL